MSDKVGFEIIDVSNPEKPKLMSFTSLDGISCHEIFVKDNYAFLSVNPDTGLSCELQIFDVSDPKKPVKISSYTTDYPFYTIYVNSNKVHLVVVGPSNKLVTLDISNINYPAKIGEYTGYGVNDVVARGNIIFLACYSHGLRILDFTGPFSYDLLGDCVVTNVEYFFVDGNYAYLKDSSLGYKAIDITDLENPTLDCSIDYFGIFILDDLFYHIQSESVLNIVDISNPHSPTSLSTIDVGREISTYPKRFFACDDYVYSSNGKLIIIDVSDPSNPFVVSTFNIFNPGTMIRNIIIIVAVALLVLSLAILLFVKRAKIKITLKRMNKVSIKNNKPTKILLIGIAIIQALAVIIGIIMVAIEPLMFVIFGILVLIPTTIGVSLLFVIAILIYLYLKSRKEESIDELSSDQEAPEQNNQEE